MCFNRTFLTFFGYILLNYDINNNLIEDVGLTIKLIHSQLLIMKNKRRFINVSRAINTITLL